MVLGLLARKAHIDRSGPGKIGEVFSLGIGEGVLHISFHGLPILILYF